MILITGISGYIGSHVALNLLELGFDIVGLDDFSNSYPSVIDNIKSVSGKDFTFYKCSILDKQYLDFIFSSNDIHCVIHLAGRKYVEASFHNPLDYFTVNVTGTYNLISISKKYNCTRFVFSSTASLYADAGNSVVSESSPISPSTPYSLSKKICEDMLSLSECLDSNYSIMVLRFFNPAGSHCSKLFSENPKCEASNLFPAIINSIKNQNEFHIFGGSYSTADGTPVRDFIHVCDLSEACVQSVRYVLTHTGYNVVNIGSGVPHTVLNIYSVFAQIANCTLSYVVMPPRYGDLPFSLADISFAYELLDWRPKRNLEQICIDSL